METRTEKISEIKGNGHLLDIRSVKIWYKTYRGYAKVVDGVNIHVDKGEKIGLVGESGCGKTTTMKTVLRLLDPSQSLVPEGEILLKGQDILKASPDKLLQVRRKEISMISQEPMAALNPVFTVGQQMMDVVHYSGAYSKYSKKEIYDLCKKTISDVLISDPDRILKSYPHQLSGGMRQRVCIATSLITPRNLLIADEPGTALDVTIQDQIHRLLRNLVDVNNLALIMITHSLGVARELVDRIYIMYAGNIVETADTKKIFSNPLHPYTAGLMKCVPRLSGGGISSGIYGYVPDYVNSAQGCRFHPRCPDVMDICRQNKPPTYIVDQDHQVACFKYSGVEVPANENIEVNTAQ